jgi:NAD(P)H-hydrate epimerase
MIEGLKVVTAEEMARLEKGGDHERWMAEAGRKVADAAVELAETRKVLLLVGKGNNGGDAFAAGICLLEAGFEVRAFRLYEGGSELNKKFGKRFGEKGGRIESKLRLDGELVIDGFLGTGFRGKIEKRMAEAIRAVNGSGAMVLAIDVPSGLDATTGEAEGAIRATETVTLGLPKIGLFLREGWNCVGKLRVVDFGLSKEAVAGAEAVAYLPKREQLPKIVRNRHKYQAGFVVGFGGSKAMTGAAKLTGLAALKVGAGIVTVFSLDEIGPAPYELICAKWNAKGWKEALKKAQAVFVGPGLGRSRGVQSWLKKHLKEVTQHCVLDADALMADVDFPKSAILTPHRGEALRLLGLKAMPREEELFARVMRFCDRKRVLVVLKGAPTWVFGPKMAPVVVPRGDPGMATAGSGDVLTGMIAGLLAQGCNVWEAAVLGVTLHGIAGEEAAKEKTSYCLLAGDLIDFMPDAFRVVAKSDIV